MLRGVTVVNMKLQAEGVTYAGQRQAMRQRTYSVLSDIKTGHAFAAMVVPPSETHDGHPGITWEAFHKVMGRIQIPNTCLKLPPFYSL